MPKVSSSKNIVIVESPAKAKTISRYLGKDFEVYSSFGHIRDLPKKGLGVDIENNFAPTYETSADKKKVVAELRKHAKGATVWLASDEDREGEAIAWHLCEALGLKSEETKRIVFHEITKPAILAAVEQPRTVNRPLVDAQQARRVLDRLVGYQLSPVLWRKVRSGLSAGRVQSVAVRLIVEREREIRDHESEVTYKVTGVFGTETSFAQTLPAELNTRFSDELAARTFLEAQHPATYSVKAIEQKPGSRNPSAPFTTSTLQQEAARRLGYSVKQTMTLAQRLYENGHITYMRTDSTVLSDQALAAASQYIKKEFGEKYAQYRTFKTKNQSAQEAHEAIRPTDITKLEAGNDSSQQKLYRLIWQRMTASQMAPAEIQKSEVTIDVSGRSEVFIAKGEILSFDGFLKVYGGGKEDVILPDVAEGQQLYAEAITATQVYSRPPARYSEASLVKKLEEMGIGRPSTYAPTISVIQDRGYIEKSDLEGSERIIKSLTASRGIVEENEEKVIVGADRAKLLPTHLAEMTTDFLVKHFSEIVDYDFTAKAEAEFDTIAEGKLAWQDMIATFYKDFKPKIDQSESISRAETSQARELGIDPKTKEPIFARYGRFGPMLQLGDSSDEDKKVTFASLPAGATLDNVTLEQALPMFDLPRTVGTTEDGIPILANIGRFGPYIQIEKKYVSIKGLDPLTITEAEAREAFANKEQAAADRNIKDFGSIKIIKGPYGPYITDGKKNARIPKDQEPAEITETEAKKLLAAAPARKARRKRIAKR